MGKPPDEDLTPHFEDVQAHYDLSDDFFRLFLGEEMTYSCAFFSRGARTLEEAQREKLELTCTKLNLQPGQRVLDVGCGWGSFAMHAAENHGVNVVGITLSEPQAALARKRGWLVEHWDKAAGGSSPLLPIGARRRRRGGLANPLVPGRVS